MTENKWITRDTSANLRYQMSAVIDVIALLELKAEFHCKAEEPIFITKDGYGDMAILRNK